MNTPRLSLRRTVFLCASIAIVVAMLVAPRSTSRQVTAASEPESISFAQECRLPEDGPFLETVRTGSGFIVLRWPQQPIEPEKWVIRIEAIDGGFFPDSYREGTEIGGNNRFHTIPILSAFKKYRFFISMKCTGGSMSNERMHIECTDSENCGEPQDLSARATSDTTANIRWDHVVGARKYILTLVKGDDVVREVPVPAVDGATGRVSWDLDALEPAVSYQVKVRTICGIPDDAHFSDDSMVPLNMPEAGTPPPGFCPTPENFREVPERRSASSAVLKWDDVPTPTGFIAVTYELFYRIPVDIRLAATGNSYTLQDLQQNTNYVVKLRAFCHTGRIINGVYSEEISTPFMTPVCTTPTPLDQDKENDFTYHSARIKWREPEGYSIGYTWTFRYRNQNPRPGQPTGWQEERTNDTKITVGRTPARPNATPLVPGARYDFQIVTHCGGDEFSSRATGEFDTKPCPTPVPLRAENKTVTSARLIWTDVADSYDLRIRKASCPENQETCWRRIDNINGNEKFVGGLESDTEYVFEVRGHCTFAEPTEWSDPKSFFTLDCSSAIPNVTHDHVKKTSAEIKWDPIPGATYYQYQYRPVAKEGQPEEPWSTLSPPLLNNFQTIGPLQKCTKYEVQVRSSCSAVCDPAISTCPPQKFSDWGRDTFTTTCAPCDSPIRPHGSPNCNTFFIFVRAGNRWNVRWATNKLVTGQWNFRWRECPTSGCINESYTFTRNVQVEQDRSCQEGEQERRHRDYIVTGISLTPGRNYEVGVQYRCDNGVWSDFATQGGPVNNLLVSLMGVTSTTATLGWEPVPNALGYEVLYGPPDEEFARVLGVDSTKVEATVEGLTPQTAYDVRVRALLPDGETAPEGFEITTAAEGKCSYSVTPTSAFVGLAGGSGDVSVSAPVTCPWTAASNDSWITVTSGEEGHGEGTVSYAVAPNPMAEPRGGSITVAGVRIMISQGGNTSVNPVPSIGTLTPETAVVGSDPINVAVQGVGFIPGSVVRVNGQVRTTTFQNAGLLSAVISSSDLATMRTFDVTVFNPSLGGGTSNSVPFVVTSATGCARYAPTVTIEPGDQRGHRSEQLTYRVSITNNDSPQCGAGTFDVIPTFPGTGWGQSPTSMGFAISSGETMMRDVLIWSAPDAPYAAHTIHQTATRLDGPSGSGNATYTVYSLLPPDTCGRATPTITISPADQQGFGGQYLTYRVTVTNNDNPDCGVMDFDVVPGLPGAGWIHSPTSMGFSILPGQNAWRDVIVASPPGAEFATHPFTENVTSWVGHAASSQANYTVYDPLPPDTCGRQNPTVTVTPNHQSGTQAQTLSYLVSVRNNDAPGCGGSSFTVRPTLPSVSSGAPWMHVPQDYFTVFAAPGETGTREISVTSASLAPFGDHTITWTAAHTRYQSGSGQATFNVIPYPGTQPAPDAITQAQKMAVQQQARHFSISLCKGSDHVP